MLARAIENSGFAAAANRTGEEHTYSFFGANVIVGPRGKLCRALDQVERNREDSQLMQIRGPHSYREIVRMY